MKNHKQGFSIAEALVTMMIISLILAAVLPVMSRRNLTNDSMWRYVSTLTGANSDVYYGIGNNQTAILGMDLVPYDLLDVNKKPYPYKSRLVVVTPIDAANDTIRRSLIDFYQRTTTTDNTTASIGRISFDQNNNVGIGKATMPTVAVNTGLSQGIGNTAIGSAALAHLTSGSYNTALGALTLNTLTTASGNTAVGFDSLINTTGANNTAVGFVSLANSTAINNVAVGSQSLLYNTGANNTAIGTNTMIGNATITPVNPNTGHDNTALGSASLIQLQNSSFNVAIGSQAGAGLTSLSDNNIAIGYQALYNGNPAQSNTPKNNVAIGYQAENNITTGYNNIAIGSNAGVNITTGYNNIIIGSGPNDNSNGAKLLNANDINKLVIAPNAANGNNTTALIYGNDTAGSRSITINGALNTTGLINGSDIRLKKILGDSNVGIERLNKIQPKNFFYKNDKTKRPIVGVIAQELQKVFPNSVVKMPNGYLGVDTSEMFYAMLNSIKDMYKQMQNLIAKVAGLDTRITSLEKENADLKTQLVQINTRLDKLEHKK